MSSRIDGKTIYLTRGDTFRSKVNIIDRNTGEAYIPQEGDTIRFAMSKKYGVKAESEILLINIPIDTMILEIQPEDTKGLKFGEYKYDIELTTSTGIVDTFIDKATLVLSEEVY